LVTNPVQVLSEPDLHVCYNAGFGLVLFPIREVWLSCDRCGWSGYLNEMAKGKWSSVSEVVCKRCDRRKIAYSPRVE